MNMESDFHMAKGDGESSYANNSKLQQKAMLETRPVLNMAVREAYMAGTHPTMTVVDLGCSSSENTLLFVANVIDAICSHRDKFSANPVELQFFLNDLPSNDFNHVFQSLEQFKESTAVNHKEDTLPHFYIAGLPSSYYNKLLPHRSVHLFHSSFCLHWRSRVPEGLECRRKTYLNEGNIYIVKTTPPSVVKLYQEQFQKDMLLFLKLRHEELVSGGQMVLTFIGRNTEDVKNGDISHLFRLLACAVQSLVDKGLVDKEKLDSFNAPFYGPSVDEVKAVVKKSEQFHINCLKLFESSWDPYENLEGDGMHDNLRSGINIAKSLKAVMAPLFASNFGASVLDELFNRFAYNVADHFEMEKTKYSIIILSLRKL